MFLVLWSSFLRRYINVSLTSDERCKFFREGENWIHFFWGESGLWAIFIIKYCHYVHAWAHNRGPQLPAVEVLIPIVEQMATVKEFSMHRLVLNWNYLGRVYKCLRSNKYVSFFNMNLYIYICTVPHLNSFWPYHLLKVSGWMV